MAVQRQDEDRHRGLAASGAPFVGYRPNAHRKLDRLDRVLEGGVVELHHVLAARRRPLQPAGQVDVDDVEAAGAEAEVERRDVDDDLVALAHLARAAPCRPRRRAARRRPRPSAGPRRRRRPAAASRRPLTRDRAGLGDDAPRRPRASRRGCAPRRSPRACGSPRCRWRAGRSRSRRRSGRWRRCRRRSRSAAARSRRGAGRPRPAPARASPARTS